MPLSPEDKEIIIDFVNEGQQGLERAEGNLLKIEEAVAGRGEIVGEFIDELFRVFHSIKGSAGFLKFSLITRLTHHAESLLDHIRKHHTLVNKQHTDILLEVCDELSRLFDYVKQHFSESGFSGHFEDLIARLETLTTALKTSGDSTGTPREEHPAEAKRSSFNLKEFEITDDLIVQFVAESTELLDALEQDLLKLEKEPAKQEFLESAFRALHSLKGNAGYLNYHDIAEVTHQLETIFESARSHELHLQPKQVSLILKIVDFVRAAVLNLAEGQSPAIPGKLGLIDLMKEMIPQPQPAAQSEQNDPKRIASDAQKKDEQKLSQVLTQLEAPHTSAKANEMVRVDVQKLDRLMDLVGEIVIAESMITHHPALNLSESEELEQAVAYLQRNIRELQDIATSMRMIPLNGLFGKMRRLVRDISLKKEKKVELEIVGGHTEVDRSIIEHLSDPLVHILRNAIDHGLEPEAERVAQGKPAAGHLVLRADRVGGEVWIEVKDDGRGLDKDKILKQARKRGLVNENKQSLTEEEIYNLIFMPGFSTAEKITNISGRGVGMDVVKKNVEKIRGHISIASQSGRGTTIRLKIPLTTAIIDAMLLRVSDTIYAIPILDIRESLRVHKQQVMDLIDGQEIIKVRDEIIPVIRLEQLHNLQAGVRAIDEGIVVVTQTQQQTVGFWVEEIIGQQQVVIKPVPDYLGRLEGVSGCAILGDGNICFILDLAILIKLAETIKI
ncbi:chemotaxis protein CheW [Caldithrix abyssi]